MALEVASLYASLGLDKSGFEGGLRSANSSLDRVGRTMRMGLAGGAIAVTGALVGTAAVVGGIAASSIQAASSMEQQLADIASVMGKAKSEVEPLKKLIVDLGMDPNLKVDATEAADAIQMLARNGLTMEEIIGGAARSTVLLANSTGGDFATAANIATDSMAIFNIEAEDMQDAVDGITSVTVSSKFDVNDYGLALAQAGGIAASSGVEFDDFNTAIAGISPLFASGSDAGTSFKTMLQRLIPSTNPAKDAFTDLGLLSEEAGNAFFDAEGTMKSMGEISGILGNALSGLSEEQRNSALSTMFGTDAMRAAVGLAELGADGFAELQATMGDTSAIDSAATRMDTFAGTLEIIQGVFDGMKLQIGDALLPTVQKFADKLLELSDTIGPKIVEFAEQAGDKLFTWVEMIEQGDFDGVMNEVGGLLTSAWDTYVMPTLSAFSEKFWDWVTGPGGAVEGVGGALTAVTTTAANWLVENWPMIEASLAEWANKFWDWVTGPDGALVRLGETMNEITTNITAWANSDEGQGQLAMAGETLGRGLISGLEAIFSVDTGVAIKKFGDEAGAALLGIGPAFLAMGEGLAMGVIEGIYNKLTGKEMSDDLANIIRSGIHEALKVANPIQLIKDSLSNIGTELGNFGLPGFAEGGVVPGAEGDPMLAMVHGGETITPPGRDAGNTFNISISANDSAGGARAADAFMDTLRSRGLVMP